MSYHPQLKLFSPRLVQALIYLCDQEGFTTVEQVAVNLGTSTRTLFRELKDINDVLSMHKLELITKPKVGIYLSGSQKQAFKSLLLQLSTYHKMLSKEERRLILLAELLKNQSLQKLIVYAHQFDVSEATISNDIDAIVPHLEKYRLNLIRKPGSNLVLEGDEELIRKAISEFIHDHIEEEDLIDLLNNYRHNDIEEHFSRQGPDSIINVVNKDILWKVISVLKEQDSIWVHRLAQNSYIGLILHLTIAIERMRNEDAITIDQDLYHELHKDPMFQRARDLSKHLEQAFDIEFPLEEIAYISMHLKGARLTQLDNQQSQDERIITQERLLNLVEELIEHFEAITKIRLKQDDILIQGLMSHFRPALSRLYYQLDIRNPLLNQIKQQYLTIFENTQKAISAMSDQRIAGFNDNEVGFISMHFGAAMERASARLARSLKLAVICSSGIGVSSLLASRLRRMLDDNISVHPRSVQDAKRLEAEGFEIIVSTIDYVESGLPIVLVNPLLSDEDLTELRRLINQQLKSEAPRKPEESDVFVDYLQETIYISQQVESLYRRFDVVYLEDDVKFNDLITQATIGLTDDPQVHQGVIEALHEREKLGSVVMKEEGFALFHAQSEWITDAKIRIIRPTQTQFICFDHAHIQLIVLLLVPIEARASLRQLMSHISAALIENEEYLHALKHEDISVCQNHLVQILKIPMIDWFKKGNKL
jgi:mannitol operon transcriptional antiterminator